MENKKLTPSQIKALNILEDTSYNKKISARTFAELMWKDTNLDMFIKVKNTGNGATRGKGAWLCGGSYLAKLIKKGWAYSDGDYGFYITHEGKKVYEEFLIGNIEEKITDFKTAKLAKEKGFDEKVQHLYTTDGELRFHPKVRKINSEQTSMILAPTQTLLRKWLKKRHNIYIEIGLDRTTDPKFCYEIFKYKDFGNWENITNVQEWGLTMDEERNLEDALYEALLTIKKPSVK